MFREQLEKMSHVDVLRVEQPCPAGISLMDGAGYGTCTTTLDAGYCLYCWFAPQERGFCIEHPTSALKFCRSCETVGGGSRRVTPRRSSWPGTTPSTRVGKHMNEVRQMWSHGVSWQPGAQRVQRCNGHLVLGTHALRRRVTPDGRQARAVQRRPSFPASER